MSATAKIIIVGKSRIDLLSELDNIEKWDNGHNHPVQVGIGDDYIYDTIENVRNAINIDLSTYISSKFLLKNKIIKIGGNDDIYVVPDPDIYDGDGKFHKKRNKMTHLVPKKKRNKKKR